MSKEDLGDFGIVRTPWNCVHLTDKVDYPCRIQIGDDGEVQCPRDFTICCYICEYNNGCCDRCPAITPDKS